MDISSWGCVPPTTVTGVLYTPCFPWTSINFDGACHIKLVNCRHYILYNLVLSSFAVVAMLDVLPTPFDRSLCTFGILAYVATSPLTGYFYGRFLQTIRGRASYFFWCFALLVTENAPFSLYMTYMRSHALQERLFLCYLLGIIVVYGLLRYFGFRLAFHKPLSQNPVRTNNSARPIPNQPWYTNLLLK